MPAANRDLIPDGAVLFEPDGMDVALLGWTETDGVVRSVYSYQRLVGYFAEQFQDAEDPEESAVEWVEVNTMGVRLTDPETGRAAHPVIVVDAL